MFELIYVENIIYLVAAGIYAMLRRNILYTDKFYDYILMCVLPCLVLMQIK